MLFHSPFLKLLDQLPTDHIVATHNSIQTTAASLKNASLGLAEHLSTKGLTKGDHVLMACAIGIEFLVIFFALIHLRVKVALVDPHMGRQLYWAKVQQFQPKWAFIDSRILLLQEHPLLRIFYLKCKKNPIYIPYTKEYKVIATGYQLPLIRRHIKLSSTGYAQVTHKLTSSSDKDELMLVYTSGTLAEPKAVVHTVRSLFQSVLAMASVFVNESPGAIVTHLPHFALIGMITGFNTTFWKENLTAKKRLNFIKDHQITTLFGTPAEYLDLVNYCQSKKAKLPACLNHLVIGSAPVLKPFLKELRRFTMAKITCLYGMTENLFVASVDGDEKLTYQGQGDLIGKVQSQVEYFIPEDGELLIKSPMLFKRYFHEKEAPPYHSTGDLVMEDDQGNLVMIGRKKNMIIRKNKNIYPGLYEETICNIPGVTHAVMEGHYNLDKHDEEVILVIEGRSGLTSNYIIKHLQSGENQIDTDALPDYILFMIIPRAGRQKKVNKKLLQQEIRKQLSKSTISL
jgi:acyl-CoA synthetase (AMP-forming)/AMP-acid ligase II